MRTLWIDDLGDGAFKAEKFERDKRMLTAAIHAAQTPERLRTRYCFYLAQTYRDLGEYQPSWTWYDRRVKAGGWPEEVYSAQCEKARLAIQLG